MLCVRRGGAYSPRAFFSPGERSSLRQNLPFRIGSGCQAVGRALLIRQEAADNSRMMRGGVSIPHRIRNLGAKINRKVGRGKPGTATCRGIYCILETIRLRESIFAPTPAC